MQLKLKITHVPGCYSVMDVDGVVYMPKHPVRNIFYAKDEKGAKESAYLEAYGYAVGVCDGWNIARNALGAAHVATHVEEVAA